MDLLSTFFVIISGIGTLLGMGYTIYRYWRAYTRQEIREATQEWAINECRIERGKVPIVFDSRESHVLTIYHKGEQLFLQSIHSPNKQLKKAIKLGITLINEQAAINRMTSKQRKQKQKLLKQKQKELNEILRQEKRELHKKYKKLRKINKRIEQLESKK
nr:MAG: hypothetical protein [Lokiarchaeota virus Ratatoskr Meg22_1012]